jgi:uncharacterized protein (TIGR02300 family)
VPNKDLGTKRICPSCGAKFYDMHKSPIECLKCEFTFVPEAPKRPTQVATPAAAAAPEAKKVSDEILAKAKESNGDDDVASAAGIDVDVDHDDDDDEQDNGVLEEASDLMGGDDDVPAVPEKAGDGSPEDR